MVNLKIVQEDNTTAEVDAIVNAANSRMLGRRVGWGYSPGCVERRFRFQLRLSPPRLKPTGLNPMCIYSPVYRKELWISGQQHW